MTSPPIHESGGSLDFEYFEKAVDVLTSHPTAIPDRCGVVANCMAGSYGGLMGINIEKVKAVFLQNGAYILPFLDLYRDNKLFVKSHPLGSDELIFDENCLAVTNSEMLHHVMETQKEIRVPIENSPKDTHYSINYGEEDTIAADVSAKHYGAGLSRGGHSNFDVECWKGTGHLIEPPNMPFSAAYFQTPWPNCGENHRGPGENKVYLATGGNPKDTAANLVSIWQKLRNFCFSNVRDKSSWYQNYLENSNSK